MATRHTRIVLAAFTLAWMAGCQTAGKTGAQAMKAKVKPGTSVLAGTHAKNSETKPLPPAESMALAIQVGQQLESQGHLREAASQYDRALAIDPNRPKLIHHLAVVHDRLGEYKAARDLYARAKALKPGTTEIDVDVAFSHYLSGEYDESIRLGRTIVESHPEQARAWNNLGLALAQKGSLDEAREAFRRASSPSQAECNLAFVLLSKGDFESAGECYRKAMELEPGMAAARAGLEKIRDSKAREVMSAQATR